MLPGVVRPTHTQQSWFCFFFLLVQENLAKKKKKKKKQKQKIPLAQKKNKQIYMGDYDNEIQALVVDNGSGNGQW